ncbi:MAG: hypothetical protein KA965_00820 [Butyrivibrio sp.]|nr:hypothetical protein [Butyrivibrio sp.]
MSHRDRQRIWITAGIIFAILILLIITIAVGKISQKSDTDEASMLRSDIAAYTDSQLQNVHPASEKTVQTPQSNALMSAAPVQEKQRDDVSGNSLYETTGAVFRDKNKYAELKYDTQKQLAEMMEYWSQNNMDAVYDLVFLDRYEAMSASVSGNQFVYYGDKDESGAPDGTGIAVYAQDQYYYGSWFKGLRNGKGEWYQFYPKNSDNVVALHMYSGEWANDLPDGAGQEHYDFNLSKMDGVSFYPQNVIGNFTKGFYNGQMYVITQDQSGTTTEWYGTCSEGIWTALGSADSQNRIPALYQSDQKEHYIWMSDAANRNYRVENLIADR